MFLFMVYRQTFCNIRPSLACLAVAFSIHGLSNDNRHYLQPSCLFRLPASVEEKTQQSRRVATPAFIADNVLDRASQETQHFDWRKVPVRV